MERNGREKLECSAPRERAPLDGVVVHLRVCVYVWSAVNPLSPG